MKKLPKAFFLRSGACFCSEWPSNPHCHETFCILKWFKLGDETEVEAVLRNVYWKNHQECSCQVFSSYSFVSHRSVPDSRHNLPIQSWPTVYLRGSARNWIHRLCERRISSAQKLATHSKWEISITERLITFCCFPSGLVILEKTTWTTLNI